MNPETTETTPSTETPDTVERWLYLGRVESSQKRGKLLQLFVTIPEGEKDWTPPRIGDLAWGTPDGAHLFDGLITGAQPGGIYRVHVVAGGKSARSSGAKAPTLVEAWSDPAYRRALSARDFGVYRATLGTREVKGTLTQDEVRSLLAPIRVAYRSLGGSVRAQFLASIVQIIVGE